MNDHESAAASVVVVNDDATQLHVLVGLLNREGLVAQAFGDAETALRGLDRRKPPRLIVTDLYMPGIDGWRFCRLLRSADYEPFNKTPLLVVSATFSGDDAARIAADLGADAFLSAPIDGRQFLEKVRALLAGTLVREPSKVLLVDDSVSFWDLVQPALVAQGYVVHTASTVQEAEARFRETAYQVAILDYHLPDRPGDSLLEPFRRLRPDCVCLMVTADSNPDLALDWMRQGAAAYLRKPFSPAYLLELCAKTRRERALLRAEDLLELRTKELRASEAQYRELVQNAHSIILRRDRSGRITFFNEFAQRFFGYSQAEILGRNVLETILAPGEGARQELAEWNTLAVREDWTGGNTRETEHRRRDGESVWIAWTQHLVHNASNRPQEILCVGNDVTARRKAEREKERLQAQLLQAQKMEAVGHLAGGVAHDFNNVLAAMIMHLSLMRQHPQLDPDLQGAIGELQKDAKRAAALTRQLLMYSRRSVLQIRTLDLREVLTNMSHLLRRLLGEHIDFLVEGDGPPQWIDADVGMVEQVVMNLCVNARDAMPKGGRLRVDSHGVEVDAVHTHRNPEARAGRFVRLRVQDTGCGMDDATLKRIFEPFFTTKEVGIGTGLGLATVQGIVKQHRGWIEVESQVGRGSRFSVFLPQSNGPVPLAPAAAEAPFPIGGNETILLVEDEPGVRQATTKFLRSHGYTVLPAANGREALNLWELHREAVRLLLTDMVMPEGMTGLELAAALRRSAPRLRVIVASGYSIELVDPLQTEVLGVCCLAKPCEPAVLLRAVRRELDREISVDRGHEPSKLAATIRSEEPP